MAGIVKQGNAISSIVSSQTRKSVSGASCQYFPVFFFFLARIVPSNPHSSSMFQLLPPAPTRSKRLSPTAVQSLPDTVSVLSPGHPVLCPPPPTQPAGGGGGEGDSEGLPHPRVASRRRGQYSSGWAARQQHRAVRQQAGSVADRQWASLLIFDVLTYFYIMYFYTILLTIFYTIHMLTFYSYFPWGQNVISYPNSHLFVHKFYTSVKRLQLALLETYQGGGGLSHPLVSIIAFSFVSIAALLESPPPFISLDQPTSLQRPVRSRHRQRSPLTSEMRHDADANEGVGDKARRRRRDATVLIKFNEHR